MKKSSASSKSSPKNAKVAKKAPTIKKESGLAPLKRKGIYFLPNLFTLAGLFSGFYGIVAAIHGAFMVAAISLFVSMIFDALDGRVARLINAQSDFGAELDSLTDMVCFGVGTGLIIYHWTLVDLKLVGFGKIGWLCAFLYVACVALRLARFNTSVSDKRYFQGLPCPSASAVLMSWVWMGTRFHWNGLWVSVLTGFFAVLLAWLMLSSVPYRSFKDLKIDGNIKFAFLGFVLLALILLAIWPSIVLFSIFGFYVLSGLYFWSFRGLMRRFRRNHKGSSVG